MSVLLFLVLAVAIVFLIDQLTGTPRARHVPARWRIAEARRLLDESDD